MMAFGFIVCVYRGFCTAGSYFWRMIGQTLKIRHDSYDRAGYMPGVNIAIKKVMGYTGMVYGFENFID